MDLTILRFVPLVANLVTLGLICLVVVVAVFTARSLTRLDLCREAAWVVALGFAGYLVLYLSTALLWFMLPAIHHHLVLRWVEFGIQLLSMASVMVAGAGFFLMRPGPGGDRA